MLSIRPARITDGALSARSWLVWNRIPQRGTVPKRTVPTLLPNGFTEASNRCLLFVQAGLFCDSQ